MEKMPRDGTFIPDRPHNGQVTTEFSGGVLCYVTKVMELTRGKLVRGKHWNELRPSVWKQLDQYDQQGMFGKSIEPTSRRAVFHLVWTYAEKVLDKRKKARCTYDRSMHAGWLRIPD